MVDEGYFIDRVDVMCNDFIIVGPEADPSGLKEAVAPLKPCRRSLPEKRNLLPGVTIPERTASR